MAQEQGQQEPAQQYQQLVARAWRDPAFKQRLLADPAAALQEQGISLPAGQDVLVVEQQPNEVVFVLPPRPAGELPSQ